MANNINISKGDIPETDAEVEKILAKKPAPKRVKKQTSEKSEVEKQPVQPVLKHKEIVFHGQINGVDMYGFTSQEILDAADKCYAFYNQTPVIQLSGDVVCNGKPIRIRQEVAEYVNVNDDHWRLIYSKLDIEPLNGTFPKARIGINKPDALEKWEETPERKTYRAKLLDALKK